MGLPANILDDGHDYKFLRLSADDPQDTLLIPAEAVEPLYAVRPASDDREMRIFRGGYPEAGGSTLARVKFSDSGNGKIAFGDKPAVKLSSWLRTKQYESFPIRIEEGAKIFVCKISFLGQVALYLEEDQVDPVAWLQKSKRRAIESDTVCEKQADCFHLSLRPRERWFGGSGSGQSLLTPDHNSSIDEKEPAYICIRTDVEGMMDTVVIALLVIEQKRRLSRRSWDLKPGIVVS